MLPAVRCEPSGRTVARAVVLVADVAEEPDLAGGREQADREGVDGRVAEAFVVEAAAGVEVVEVGADGGGAEEAQVANLEVAEELAVVIDFALGGVDEPGDVGGGVEEVGV